MTSHAWTIGKSKKNQLEKSDSLFTPGPGHYHTEHKVGITGTKFGKSKREEIDNRNQVPGPGMYESKEMASNPPKYTMGTLLKSKEPTSLVVSPGPAMYSPKYEKEAFKSPAYTIRKRPNTAKEIDNSIPGPGQYDISQSLQRPSTKFAKTERNVKSKNESVLGPGQYYNINKFGTEEPKYSFGKDIRREQAKEKTPGPGQYEESRKFGDGRKISMSFVKHHSKTEVYPGPGQYETHQYKPTTPSMKLGKSRRDYDPISNEKFKYPGPQKYEPKIEMISNKITRNFSFGKEKRQIASENMRYPGPGAYYNMDKFGKDAPKFSMRIKPKIITEDQKVPGPGHYESDNLSSYQKKSPSWKIGTSKKNCNDQGKEARNVPGPGMYEIYQERGSAVKFGKEKRNNSMIKNDNPGPGQYRIPCSFRDVPQYISASGNFEDQFRFI